MAETLTSRIFMNGNSQALRIPKALRFETTRVSLSRTKEGGLLVLPLPDGADERAARLMAALESFDELGEEDRDAFISVLEDDRRNPQPEQEREPF